MTEFYGNTPIDALIALGVVALIVGVGVGFQSVLLRRIVMFAKRTESSIDDVLVLVARSLGVRFYAVFGVWAAARFFLTLPPAAVSVLDAAFAVFLGLQVIIIVSRVIDFSIRRYVKTLDRGHRALATTLPSLGLLLKGIVGAFVVIFVLSNLGVDVTTLIAGLGIGGLAAAFAFQKILADLFSTFIIFFDKPFSAGDMIAFGDVSGTIDNVGIKTTRIRAFTGEMIIVPNEDLVRSVVRNTTDRPLRKVALTVPIAYSANMKKLVAVPDIIEKIVGAHEKTDFGHAKVREFGEHAIMFEVVYKTEGAGYDEHVAIRHQIHLQMLEALAAEKITLGYPLQSGTRTRVVRKQ